MPTSRPLACFITAVSARALNKMSMQEACASARVRVRGVNVLLSYPRALNAPLALRSRSLLSYGSVTNGSIKLGEAVREAAHQVEPLKAPLVCDTDYANAEG